MIDNNNSITKTIKAGDVPLDDLVYRPIKHGVPAGMYDTVKKPSHYNAGKYEVIDIIESILNTLKVEPFQAYCLGNSLKYIARAGLKGDFKEDIKKALMYLQWAIGEDPRNE